MFKRFKKSFDQLLDAVTDEVIEAVSTTTEWHSTVTRTGETSPPASEITAELPPIERATKAEPVYPRKSRFDRNDLNRLSGQLDDPNPQTQVYAIQAVQRLIEQWPSQIWAFSETLALILSTNPEPPARAAAAEVLCLMQRPKQAYEAGYSRHDIDNKVTQGYYDQAVDALIHAMLSDDDLLTRQTAAETLMRLPTHTTIRRAQDHVWRDDNSDDYVRLCTTPWVGIGFVTRLSGDERRRAEDLFLQAFMDFSDLRYALASQFQRMGLGRAVPFIDAVVEQLTLDTEQEIRTVLITLLGRVGNPNAVTPLVRYMNNPDRRVSKAALDGLAALGNPAATPALKAFNRTLATTDSRRNNLKRALVQCGETGTSADQIRILQDSNDIGDLKNALQALGVIGDPAAIEALIGVMRQPPLEWMRDEAYAQLVKHPTREVAEAMIDGVCDGTLSYRQVSWNFVSQMNLREAYDWLEKAVATRATPEAQPKIKRDKAFLNRF